MSKKSANEKQTYHRIAASNPEVKKLLKKLKRTWKRSTGDERRHDVTELLSKGCSIRGIAEYAHLMESTVRVYSKTSSAEAAENKRQRLVPKKVLPKKSNAPTVSKTAGELGPAQKKQQSLKALLDVFAPIPPFKSRFLQTERTPGDHGQAKDNSQESKIASSEPAQQPEEPIESMRNRPHEVLVEFIRAELGGTEKAADPKLIAEIIEEARTYNVTGRMSSPRIGTWPGMTSGVFVERIKQALPRRPQGVESKYLGLWGVKILHNLIPNSERQRGEAIDVAEQILLQQKPTQGWVPGAAASNSPAAPSLDAAKAQRASRILHVDLPVRHRGPYDFEKRLAEAEERLHPGRRKPF